MNDFRDFSKTNDKTCVIGQILLNEQVLILIIV